MHAVVERAAEDSLQATANDVERAIEPLDAIWLNFTIDRAETSILAVAGDIGRRSTVRSRRILV